MNETYQAPCLISAAFLIVILILVCLRRLLVRAGDREAIQIGNGQTAGSREEQEDYFSTTITARGTLAVLADGISGFLNGRLASTTAVNTFVSGFETAVDLQNTGDFFTRTARLSNKEILRKLKGAKGGATLAAAIIAGGCLHWASVGSSAIAVFRKGELIHINKKNIWEPRQAELTSYLGHEGFKSIETGSEPVQLRKRDKVILCSAGVYNSLTEIELERLLSRNVPPYDAAQDIIESINQKKLKHQDNATIIILEKG